MTNGNGNLPHHNLYINGQWRAPLAEQYRPTSDPSTGEELGMIAQADIEDTRLAIQAARLLGVPAVRRGYTRRDDGVPLRRPKRMETQIRYQIA